MKIAVGVKLNAKKIAVEKIGEEYVVSVNAPPVERSNLLTISRFQGRRSE